MRCPCAILLKSEVHSRQDMLSQSLTFLIARHSFSFITKARLKTLDMKHLHEAQGFSLNRKPFGVRHGSIYSGKAVPKNSRDRCRFCRFSASISRFDNNRDAELSNFLIRKEVQQPLDYF